MVTVYSLPVCPNCKVLKEALTARGIEFEEKDLDTPEAKTTLLMAGVFTALAPVLESSGKYYVYDKIFDETGSVNPEVFREEKG